MKYPGKILPEVWRSLFKEAATINYPHSKVEMPTNYRGKIAFDAQKCIGCKICMRDCPAKAIEIQKVGEEKVFQAKFYLDQCIYCAQCVDSCPKKALSSTPDYELACYERQSLTEIQK